MPRCLPHISKRDPRIGIGRVGLTRNKQASRTRFMHRERKAAQEAVAMREVDPRMVDSMPLSKADTAGYRFLRLCNFLSWATTLAASCAIVLFILLIIFERPQVEAVVLQIFAIPMAGAVILAEREVGAVLKLCAFLDSWVLKGFYISFTGTLLLVCGHLSTVLGLWTTIVGYTLVGTGVLYVTLGALCFHRLRSYQLSKIRRKKLMRQELTSLSAQKQEIEKLLADTESKLQLL